MYTQFYDLIMQYIFAGAQVTAHVELMCTAMASVGVVALVAIPFVLVYWFFRRFF